MIKNYIYMVFLKMVLGILTEITLRTVIFTTINCYKGIKWLIYGSPKSINEIQVERLELLEKKMKTLENRFNVNEK